MKWITIHIALLICFVAHAQQAYYISDYLNGVTEFNPAYVGSTTGFSCSQVSKIQWQGFEEGIQVHQFSAHAPFASFRMGGGINLSHFSQQGINQTKVALNGAYRLRFSAFAMHFGLKLGMFREVYHIQDLTRVDPNDPLIGQVGSKSTQLIPGVGLYLKATNWFFGVSSPQITSLKAPFYSSRSEQFQEIYLMGGHVWQKGNSMRFRLSGLVRIQSQNKLLIDANAGVLFGGKLWTGLHGGTGSNGLYFHYRIKPEILIGYGYDLNFQQGSQALGNAHLITLRYDITKGNRRIVSFHL